MSDHAIAMLFLLCMFIGIAGSLGALWASARWPEHGVWWLCLNAGGWVAAIILLTIATNAA